MTSKQKIVEIIHVENNGTLRLATFFCFVFFCLAFVAHTTHTHSHTHTYNEIFFLPVRLDEHIDTTQ